MNTRLRIAAECVCTLVLATVTTIGVTITPKLESHNLTRGEQLVDGSGLEGTGDDTTKVHVAHSGGGSPFPMAYKDPYSVAYVVFDLGDTYDLDSLFLWNGNQTDNDDRGAKTFDLRVSYSLDFTTATVLPVSGLTRGDGVNPIAADVISLAPLGDERSNVRYVRFDNFTIFDTANETILVISELRFTGSVRRTPIVVGQHLKNRPTEDGGTGNLFAAEGFGFACGKVSEWSFRSRTNVYAGVRNITPVILEQTGDGGLGNFTIRGIGTTRAVAHSADVQTFPFGLVSGSASMGPRHAFGWKDSAVDGGANPGVISWTNGGGHWVLWLGGPNPISVGLERALSRNLERRYSLQVAIDTPNAEAVGNGTNQRPTSDGANGGVFILDDPFTRTGVLAEWAFWSWTSGRSVTPLLLEKVGGTYVLRAVGASRAVPTEQGAITYPFERQSGDTRVGPNYYFGWVDASVNADGDPTSNQGVIRHDQDVNETFSRHIRYFGAGFGAGTFLPGRDFGAGTYYNRTYSVQAIAVSMRGTVLVVR